MPRKNNKNQNSDKGIVIGAIALFVVVCIVVGQSVKNTSETSNVNANFNTPREYKASLTCEFGGSRMVLSACLNDSHVEVRSGNFSKIYQPYQLTVPSLELNLKDRFEVSAQNTSRNLLLRLRVRDTNSGQVIYDRSAGQYDVLMVADWML
ncbi:MAG: hypothetical protein II942_01385 [Alphaproteobacteria bacterium]|nr:hypothetical protein [Alphaproteobacteria bacterium]